MAPPERKKRFTSLSFQVAASGGARSDVFAADRAASVARGTTATSGARSYVHFYSVLFYSVACADGIRYIII